MAVESFQKMDKQAGSRIKNKLYNRLAKQEDSRRHPQVKKIVGVQNLFRYRVGDYRVLFRVLDHQVVIIVVHVGHRSKVYRKIDKREPDTDLEIGF